MRRWRVGLSDGSKAELYAPTICDAIEMVMRQYPDLQIVPTTSSGRAAHREILENQLAAIFAFAAFIGLRTDLRLIDGAGI